MSVEPICPILEDSYGKTESIPFEPADDNLGDGPYDIFILQSGSTPDGELVDRYDGEYGDPLVSGVVANYGKSFTCLALASITAAGAAIQYMTSSYEDQSTDPMITDITADGTKVVRRRRYMTKAPGTIAALSLAGAIYVCRRKRPPPLTPQGGKPEAVSEPADPAPRAAGDGDGRGGQKSEYSERHYKIPWYTYPIGIVSIALAIALATADGLLPIFDTASVAIGAWALGYMGVTSD